MAPLTTITILVYDLVRVNLVTRSWPRHGRSVWCSSGPAKKNRANTEPAKSGKPARQRRDCQTVLRETTRERTPADGSGKVCTVQKREFSERLWISQSISTGWLVRKHEVNAAPIFYTILLLRRYRPYAGFFLRVNDWSCWKKTTYPQKDRRLLLLLFFYMNLL